MAKNMTRNTNSNNIKPMFLGIAFVMMVLLCLITTGAFENCDTWNFACFNSIVYGTICFHAFWITLILSKIFSLAFSFTLFALHIALASYFAFFSFVITLINGSVNFFAFFALLIAFHAILAMITITIFLSAIFMKFRNWFDLFASRTSFCYDCVIHRLFLNKRLCLGHLQANPVFGSFYYKRKAWYLQ